MKNESPILDPFLDQISAFFDSAIILDHGSTDDSRAKVSARFDSKIELFQLKASGYPQAEVASLFAHRIFDRDSPDFLFFLDCDEFLPFQDRRELETFLDDKKTLTF
jgi:hypothetical protein